LLISQQQQQIFFSLETYRSVGINLEIESSVDDFY